MEDKVKKFYFSRDNITMLTKKLATKLKISKDGVNACAELVKSQLVITFNENKKVLQKTNNLQEIIQYLNGKILNRCVQIYDSKRKKTKKKDDLMGIGDFGGNLATIANGPGEFIRADGSMGDKFLLGVDLNNYIDNNDRDNLNTQDILKKRMYEREQLFNSDVMSQRSNNKKPDFDPSLFALDGSARRKKQESVEPSSIGGMDNNSNFSGLDQYFQTPTLDQSEFLLHNKPDRHEYDNRNDSHHYDSRNESKNNDMQQLMQMMQTLISLNIQNNTQQQSHQHNSQKISQVNEVKTNIASTFGLDPHDVLNMSSSDIEKLIDSKNKRKQTPEIEETKQHDPTKILEMMMHLKKITNPQTDRKKVQIIEDDNNVLDIVSSKYSEPECYHQYVISIKELLSINSVNVSKITILDCEFPQDIYLDDTCNFMTINDDKKLKFDPGIYSLDDIIELLNENIDDSINVTCDNGHVTFQSNVIFDLNFCDSFLGKLFGFTENFYKNKSRYVSEYISSFCVNSYQLFIKNIADDPIAIIRGNKITQKIKVLPKSLDIKHIEIMFKNEDSGLHYFGAKPHSIKFQFD